MATPGMDKSAFVRGATKAWKTVVSLDEEAAFDAINKINNIFVKKGQSLESVLGKRSNLWKEISSFLQAKNIDKTDVPHHEDKQQKKTKMIFLIFLMWIGFLVRLKRLKKKICKKTK